MPDEPKSFWTSIPGVLTGAAALITAVGGLIYHQAEAGRPGPSSPGPPFNTEAPVPSIYTDGCVINGEPVLITASNVVLSKARNLMQVGVRVPPHPNCRFCLDVQGEHYCVGPTGQVHSAGMFVGNCWPCTAGNC